jgi:hypothetical protein
MLTVMWSGIFKRIIEFVYLREGFPTIQVLPYYTSQMCPKCGYIHKNNRHWEKFKCLNCWFSEHADVVWSEGVKLLVGIGFYAKSKGWQVDTDNCLVINNWKVVTQPLIGSCVSCESNL